MQGIMEMLARIDASMRSNQAKAEANHKDFIARWEADSQAWREEMATEREAFQAETKSIEARTAAM